MTSRNSHKILLIEPPFQRLYKDTYGLQNYPLALGYLAGMIRRETDWKVMTYNADFTQQTEGGLNSYLAGVGFHNYLKNLRDPSAPVWQEVKSTIATYEPTVVGISAKSQTFASACIVAKLAKEVNNEVIVIVGGPHPSMVGTDALKCPDIDICVKGEGEITIVELLKAIEGGSGFDGICGVAYRKDDRILENPPREFVKDLDCLPFPHETAPEVLKDYDRYPTTAFKSVFATRGCPHNCFYCGSRQIWSRNVRFRSPENVVSEIKSLQKKGLESVHFDDDTFGINGEYIKSICTALMEHCQGLKWSCELHVRLATEENLSLMKSAGCNLIILGIESGNNEILRKIRKNITVEQAFTACEIIKKQGIQLFTFFMIGFPWETESALYDTLSAMQRVKEMGCGYIVYSIFTPYPGTEAFQFCRDNGLIDDNWDISLYNHQSPANCFCLAIEPERFRMLARRIEETIDSMHKGEPGVDFRKIMGSDGGSGKGLRRGSIIERALSSAIARRITELKIARTLRNGGRSARKK